MDTKTSRPVTVACMDVFAPPVREAIGRVTPDGYTVRFAETYDESEQFALARDADILLVGGARIPGQMLDQAPRVRMIQKWGIGVDKIDLDKARANGIVVAITGGANAVPVAELAVGLMLSVYRRIPFADRNLRQGVWLKTEMRSWCYQIDGKTIGLFGFGAIARMVAHRLRGFDCRIVYTDPVRADRPTEKALNAQFLPFEELLAESDILSVHTPLTPSTRNAIDAAALARMKPGAIIVNTARGGIIDEAALLAAIESGQLAGAGLDAFATEPLPADSPLLGNDRIVVTPHAGGGVLDNVENVARHAFANMAKFMNGEPQSPADRMVDAPSPATTDG